jgi:hypothetical protein
MFQQKENNKLFFSSDARNHRVDQCTLLLKVVVSYPVFFLFCRNHSFCRQMAFVVIHAQDIPDQWYACAIALIQSK